MMAFNLEILSSVGWALVHFIWQGAVVGGLILLLLSHFKNRSAQFRYLLSCVGLGICPLLFVTTLAQQLNLEKGNANHSTVVQSASSQWVQSSSYSLSISQVIAALWIIGVGIMMIRYARQGFQARSLKFYRTSKTDPKWETIFKSLTTILKISPAVTMLRSHTVNTPMVVGCLKPIVLVPVSAFLSLTPDQLRAVLLHELAHIKRQDHWVNLLQNLIEAILFFHPVVWWLSSRIRVEREYCCDEFSVEMSDDPRDLAEALLQMESLRVPDTNVGLAASGGSLKERIARIIGISLKSTNHSRSYPIMKTKSLGTLLFVLFLSGGGLFLANAGERLSKEEFKERRDDIKKAVKDGELSKEEAKEKLKALKKASRGPKEDKEDKEEKEGDIEELEHDLKRAVKSGKMSEHEARQKLVKAQSEKIHKEARRHQEHVRRKVELATKQIREAVESGEMSEEKGRAHLRELHKDVDEEARRVHQEVHKRNVQLHLKHTEHVLRKQVETGNLTEDEARQKLEGIRNKIKQEHARRQHLEHKTRKEVSEQGRRIRKAVESGELSREDAEAKFKELHRNAERRFKAENQRAKEEDKSQQFYKYRAEIQRAVEEGKLDEEEAEKKLNAVHSKIFGADDRDREDDDDDHHHKHRRGKGDDDDGDGHKGKRGDDDDDKGKGDDDDNKRRSGKGDDDDDDDDRRGKKHGDDDDDEGDDDDDKRKSDDDD